MRRLPIYFLLDVSESMVGPEIEQVQEGMRQIVTELRTDPYALETAYISVIAFAGQARTLTPLTEVTLFYPPKLPIGSGTSLGKALMYLMDEMDRTVQKTTKEAKGDWKPVIFLFTDGNPTDDYEKAFKRWNGSYRNHCNLIIVSLGENADTQMLSRISENVLCLKETDKQSFKSFFKWITATIKASSMSVSEGISEDVVLPARGELNLEKADSHTPCKIDENFVVLVGKCQETKKLYLVKYAMKSCYIPTAEDQYMKTDGFKLVGAYPIDEEMYSELSENTPTNLNIHSNRLHGVPSCPCCGNQIGLVMCQCGKLFCVGDKPVNTCPWCGSSGSLSAGSSEGFDVARARG